jgi:alpha-tubulin suppressor-like RCC1 family protein
MGVRCFDSSDYIEPPLQVTGITTAKSIAAGLWHSCALLEEDVIMCWGYNEYGQLGDGTTTIREQPVEVLGVENPRSIALGFDHSCAVLTDGKIMCWGKKRVWSAW